MEFTRSYLWIKERTACIQSSDCTRAKFGFNNLISRCFSIYNKDHTILIVNFLWWSNLIDFLYISRFLLKSPSISLSYLFTARVIKFSSWAKIVFNLNTSKGTKMNGWCRSSLNFSVLTEYVGGGLVVSSCVMRHVTRKRVTTWHHVKSRTRSVIRPYVQCQLL